MTTPFLLFAALAFTNPIVDADMSDPDCATADGTNFWLTVSSFTDLPGLPLYHSTDLVHWNLKGHALVSEPEECAWHRIGHGVWAPSIRFHDGLWHIFWGDPDAGIFQTVAKDPQGEWSEPELLVSGSGLIDPCPFWDEDGTLHIVNAFAASRAKFNSVLQIDGRIVYDGIPEGNHTVEGPKLYRHGGYYWIFAPARGVVTGVQLAMRSKSLYGPYESRVVLQQGKTAVNGPHQGAWVQKGDGSEWFLHFQDKGYLGRVLHLQPVTWTADGWPVLGDNGEPVAQGDGGAPSSRLPVDWIASGTVFETPKGMRLYSGAKRLTKIPAAEFTAKASLTVWAKSEGGHAGIVLIGDKTARLTFRLDADGNRFEVLSCLETDGKYREGKHRDEKLLGHIPAQKINAGARDAWRADVAVEVSCRPAADDPRIGEFVFTAGAFRSGPIRLANSIWQGVKIGVAVENEQSTGSFVSKVVSRPSDANWIDITSFTF